ncbi:unnamed protein product [Pieris macdunnoughi]|uniref:Uncharacterized protein n=1 Tax=Pieris macdunnoughi TaxID=345717 RepID=A0A821LT31_9NEOP|nr:unnamed protein product [Pieris macdunnoughi]
MARQRPTTRHFHNQPELRRGDSSGLMLRWIFLGWLASCGPLGNTVKQDASEEIASSDLCERLRKSSMSLNYAL